MCEFSTVDFFALVQSIVLHVLRENVNRAPTLHADRQLVDGACFFEAGLGKCAGLCLKPALDAPDVSQSKAVMFDVALISGVSVVKASVRSK